MSRKLDLPVRGQVLQVLADLASASGRPPSVVALARRLGLTNATFWRHYPDIAREVAAQRRASPSQSSDPDTYSRPGDDLRAQIAQLREANQALTEQLDLAIASIQRLSIENHQLRQDLEAAAAVTHLPNRRRGTPARREGS
jgi:hypothetical protein